MNLGNHNKVINLKVQNFCFTYLFQYLLNKIQASQQINLLFKIQGKTLFFINQCIFKQELQCCCALFYNNYQTVFCSYKCSEELCFLPYPIYRTTDIILYMGSRSRPGCIFLKSIQARGGRHVPTPPCTQCSRG